MRAIQKKHRFISIILAVVFLLTLSLEPIYSATAATTSKKATKIEEGKEISATLKASDVKKRVCHYYIFSPSETENYTIEGSEGSYEVYLAAKDDSISGGGKAKALIDFSTGMSGGNIQGKLTKGKRYIIKVGRSDYGFPDEMRGTKATKYSFKIIPVAQPGSTLETAIDVYIDEGPIAGTLTKKEIEKSQYHYYVLGCTEKGSYKIETTSDEISYTIYKLESGVNDLTGISPIYRKVDGMMSKDQPVELQPGEDRYILKIGHTNYMAYQQQSDWPEVTDASYSIEFTLFDVED